MQTILVTSYVDTYVINTYEDRAMKWNVLVNAASLPNYPVRIGYLAFKDTTRYYQEYQYSFTNDYDNLDKIQRIDTVQQTGASEPGLFYYELDDNNDATFINPGYECRKWLDEDEAFDISTGTSIDSTLASSCAESLNNAQLYSYNKYINVNIPTEYTCYTLKRAALYPHTSDASLDQVQTPRCCYDSRNALVTQPTLLQGLNLFQRFSSTIKQNEEMAMYENCCSQGHIKSGSSTLELCNAFKERRPPASSASTTKRAGGK